MEQRSPLTHIEANVKASLSQIGNSLTPTSAPSSVLSPISEKYGLTRLRPKSSTNLRWIRQIPPDENRTLEKQRKGSRRKRKRQCAPTTADAEAAVERKQRRAEQKYAKSASKAAGKQREEKAQQDAKSARIVKIQNQIQDLIDAQLAS